jgi:large subunit ribosomal protein L15
MKYNQLQAAKYSKRRRAGRGISAGQGRTAGRGTKGQGARKSGGVRPGFEGGQMPLYKRLPHLRGFKSRRIKAETVYTGQLEVVRKAAIDNQALFEAGILSTPFGRSKLVVKGELKTKKDVRLQAASKPAIAVLKKAGGSFTAVDRTARPAKKTD